MKVENNVNSPTFGYFMIKKNPETIGLLRRLAKEEPKNIIKLQQAGELLGAKGDPNGAKFLDMMVEDYNHYDLWSDLRLRAKHNGDIFWGELKDDRYWTVLFDKSKDCYTKKWYDSIRLWVDTENISFNMQKYEDKSIKVYSDGNWLTYSVENAALLAKFLKIWDNFSRCTNSGIPVRSDIVEIPKIKRAMSVKELIQKYGVEA